MKGQTNVIGAEICVEVFEQLGESFAKAGPAGGGRTRFAQNPVTTRPLVKRIAGDICVALYISLHRRPLTAFPSMQSTLCAAIINEIGHWKTIIYSLSGKGNGKRFRVSKDEIGNF